MEAIRIIKTFIKLLTEKRSEFSPESWRNLSQLSLDLASLPNDQALPTAEAILDWCENYPEIQTALRNLRQDIGEEEEDIPESDPRWQAMMIQNITLLQKVVKEATQQDSTDNTDTNN